jgi:hypothetical protein
MPVKGSERHASRSIVTRAHAPHQLVADELRTADFAEAKASWRAQAEGKIHRVDPDFGPTLTVCNRDSQSNCWVNWKIMSHPCELQVLGQPGPARPLPRSAPAQLDSGRCRTPRLHAVPILCPWPCRTGCMPCQSCAGCAISMTVFNRP